MATKLRTGSTFLYDEATDDIVGLRDPDGSELYFQRVPRLGAFFATTTQTDGSGPVAMAFNTQAVSRGVSLRSASQIQVDRSGLYEWQLSVHLHNADNQAHGFELWGRINGTDIANSRFIYTVPASHGGKPGTLIPSQNFWLPLQAGDYVEIVWVTDSANVTIAYHAAEEGLPIAPSLLLTVKEIAPLTA